MSDPAGPLSAGALPTADPGRVAGLTVRGRCLLAGGAATVACALVLDERDLVRAGVVVLALPLLALLLADRVRRGVRARRRMDTPRLPVGADTGVTLELSGGPLLGALRLTDAVPDAVGPSAAAPPRFTVQRLGAEPEPRYALRPVLRGVHRIGPLTARVGDPLGLAEFPRELAGPERLVVLPRVTVLRGLPPAVGSGDGAPGATRTQGGPGSSDVLVRPWREGDELRRVHWRSSARHDELMVRVEERPWRGGLGLLLDRRASAHRGHGPGSSLEFAVELAASVCAHLHRRGEPVALVTEDGRALPAAIDPALDALAALRPSARTELTAAAAEPGGDLLAVLGAVGPDDLELLLARPAGGHAVLLDVSTWAGARPDPTVAAHAETLRRGGWHVTAAAHGTDVERVWDALVGGAARAARAGAP